MDNINESKKEKMNIFVLIFSLAITVVLVGGGTMAWLTWRSGNNTVVSFTVEGGSLTIDGGGDLTGYSMDPTNECNHSAYAIKRTITATAVNKTSTDMIAYIQLHTSSSLFPNVYKIENLEWVISSSNSDCSTSSNILASGNFSNIDNTKSNIKDAIPLDLIRFSVPTGETVNKTYYLYIWVNEDYTVENVGNTVTSSIQGVDFTVQVTGKMENAQYMEPAQPILDEGMIPVTISNTGVAKTISENDQNWYNYQNKEWANVVLVDSDSRSTYQGTTGTTVNTDDILAYYVWIPRYKYRITNKCSTFRNPTIENSPGCYGAPYAMNETDKSDFISFVQMVVVNNGLTDFTIDQASYLVEEGLETGILKVDNVGQMTINEAVTMYNSMMGTNVELTLLPSSVFNENNITSVSSAPRTIDIAFEVRDSEVTNGDAVTSFRTHPAFVWDGETVSGIWVGKFETSYDSDIISTCHPSFDSPNCSDVEPRIVPNVSSLNYQNLNASFITSLKFAGGTMNTSTGAVTFSGNNAYGLTNDTDSHMMKNSEWGAVAYLSHSQYGINEEIYINDTYGYTGASHGSVGIDGMDYSLYGYYTWTGQSIDSSGTIGEFASDRTLGTKASTTGNVTGIYDMSGGSIEQVMGISDEMLSYAFTTIPEDKYYDLYAITSISECTLEQCGGHALLETANWYQDLVEITAQDKEEFTFYRGGTGGALDFISGSGKGVFTAIASDFGGDDMTTWRSVLVTG